MGDTKSGGERDPNNTIFSDFSKARKVTPPWGSGGRWFSPVTRTTRKALETLGFQGFCYVCEKGENGPRMEYIWNGKIERPQSGAAQAVF